jgi:hypothetical protein
MVETSMSLSMNDDPRRLRGLLDRACDLAEEHALPSVMLGLAGPEGDLRFPEFIVYLQSALRVEDAIFRMTRERAVIHLADLERPRAQEVIDRLLGEFCDEFPSSTAPNFEIRFFDVKPGAEKPRVKDMLTEIFSPPMLH